jgi:hypothetical protein
METADWVEYIKKKESGYTTEEKKIALQSKIITLDYIENYPCNCDKKQMKELMAEIKRLKWEYQSQLNELNKTTAK